MKKFGSLVALLCCGLLLGGAISIVRAEEGIGLSVSPLTFELTANRGDILVNRVRIYNPSGSAISVKMETEDFTVTGESGEVLIEPAETETYSLARWVRIEPQEFTLDPREFRFVDFYIDVPQNAEPGGHYGSVLANITGTVGQEITGLATAQKVGSLLLLSVSGDAKESLRAVGFSAPSFSEYGPIDFDIRFKNEGTVHVRPRGFVTITNFFNKKVTDVEFQQLNVIPGAVRKVKATWDQKILIGRYTATLVGSYGANNTPIEPVVITFWAFPWKVGSLVIAGALLILFFFVKTRKRWWLAIKILIKGEKSHH